MAIGSNNPFPSVLVVEGTVPSTPSAGQQRLYIDSTTHLLKVVNSSGTASNVSTGLTNPLTTTGDIIYSSSGTTAARLAAGTSGYVLTAAGAGVAPAWAAAAGGGLLADKSYSPDTQFVNVGTASSMTAIDTTNLRLAITSGFAGGNVLIRLSCLAGASGGLSSINWGVMEGASVLANCWTIGSSGPVGRYHQEFVINLSSGAHNLDWSYIVVTGGGQGMNMWASGLTAGTNHWGPALMEAYLAP